MTEPLVPISLQMYTLRAPARADFADVLRRVGAMGYVGVELAGLNGLTPSELATVLDDVGLVVSAAHLRDATPDALRSALDDLQVVDCNTAVLNVLEPDAFADASGIARVADLVNAANEIARERNVTVGYHNHWWEFESLIDGRSGWELLWEQLDPTVIAELDMYWAIVGGAKLDEVAAGLGDRLRLLHVKDGPAEGQADQQVAVGDGSLDIPAAIARRLLTLHGTSSSSTVARQTSSMPSSAATATSLPTGSQEDAGDNGRPPAVRIRRGRSNHTRSRGPALQAHRRRARRDRRCRRGRFERDRKPVPHRWAIHRLPPHVRSGAARRCRDRGPERIARGRSPQPRSRPVVTCSVRSRRR